MNDKINNGPGRGLHGVTCAAISLVFGAGVYLNLNVVDILYRVKYGPVRPSLPIAGWPFDAVDADVVSAVLRVDAARLLANVIVILAITTGTALRVERWRRSRQAGLRFGLKHCAALGVLGVILLALEIVKRLESRIDPIDYVAVLRWPALTVAFLALVLSCAELVDLLAFLTRRFGCSPVGEDSTGLASARPRASGRVLMKRMGPLIIIGALSAAAVIAWRCGLFSRVASPAPSNSILVIAPYRYHGTWVFDDPALGLAREPFVGGVPEMIDVLVKDIPAADEGFRLTFSAQPFPGYQKKLTWVRGDAQGNWYRLEDPPMEGWLCPALLKYYRRPPKELYVKADPRG